MPPLREVSIGPRLRKRKGRLDLGFPSRGTHPGLLQAGRTRELSYVRDPDFGDEAYDLATDPHELRNLLATRQTARAAGLDDMRRRVGEWEAECLALRDRLGVVPGWRGFAEGWE